jgi:hypothetical protein
MNSTMQTTTPRAPAAARLAAVTCAALAAAACGGGGSGEGRIGFGSGQDPDPVVLDFPIAYVKRPLPVDDNGDPTDFDVREPVTFDIGADLYVRDRASPSTADVNVTGEITEGLGDVRDLEVSSDGTRVLFAMRAQFIEGADEEDQPTWNVWEYDIPGDTLRRVIDSDIVAESGHDLAPAYLPDGRIIFSSTRQRQSGAVLLDEGKPQFSALDEDRNVPAVVLHVMNSDGTDIRQVSFNQSHDLDPAVLSNGQIVFSRWDNAPGNDGIHLYRMNPDGAALELLYGANSHDTGSGGEAVQFLRPRELPNGNVMALLRPFDGAGGGGDIIEIDVASYIENTQPNRDNIGVLSGPAQTTATINEVLIDDDAPSPGGRYNSVFPLRDGTERLLVSWSQCRLQDPTDLRIVPCTDDNLADPALAEAPPLYGIWIYDRSDETQQPVVAPEEGFMYTDIVAAEPDTGTPPVIFDDSEPFTLDPDIAAEGAAVIHVRSVYDIAGEDVSGVGIDVLADPAQTTADERPARFLRVVKAVSIPDEDVRDFDNSAFGVSAAQGMREIVGYAEVEPDGSVMMKVPANVALGVSILDGEGRRIGPRHNNWLQLRPGQLMECAGCHDPGSGESHGRADAYPVLNEGAEVTGQPFPNTDPALFADVGETMAEVRARVSCNTDCAGIEPSLDIVYEDVWTDEVAAGRAKDESFAWRYGPTAVAGESGLETLAPTTPDCVGDWSATCRAVINYEAHIHPLWSKPRIVDVDEDGVPEADNTCITCHTRTDAMGQLKVPDGQLELTDGASPDEPDHFNAYRELLAADNEQVLDMGALVDRLVEVGIDPDTGDPILEPVTVPASMSTAGANASGRFFSRFAPGGSHAGWLTPAELKLLSEWLDIGGQYYNNPFDAPED